MSYQVICIKKQNLKSSSEHITHIGYIEDFFLPKIVITVEDAIKKIVANQKVFHIDTPQGWAYLQIEQPEGKKPFLKSVTEKNQIDCLLRLNQIR